MFEAFDAPDLSNTSFGAVKVLGYIAVQCVDDQAGLSGARDTCDTSQCAERDIDVLMLEVVVVSSNNTNEFSIARSSLLGDLYLPLAADELSRETRLNLTDLLCGPLGDNLSTMYTCAWTHVDDVVGISHRLFIVLDDENCVANIP